MGKVPIQVLKELEHQSRQNLSTINFTPTFARTASSCNMVMEKCLHSAKATFKRVRNQILKGADPERAARHGYENACDYFDLMNRRNYVHPPGGWIYYYVHPPGGWIYYFCFFRRPMSGVRRPMSGVTHGFRSFKGKVLELLSPNLVCRLIGSVACLGLLLAVVPLLLTE